MHHPRSRGVYRARHAEPIELGNEAPLSVDGASRGFVDRRRVSVQWLAGAILTALSGAALMGGAVFTSLDGETNFAALPERVEVALHGAFNVGSEKISARKSDRLPTYEEPTYARQLIRVSTISRAGNHEVVRVRPFVRIAGNLSLAASDLSAGIPPFNPQRLLAESGGEGATPAKAPEPEPDAEVAFVMRDLAPMLAKLKIAVQAPKDEVMARVREAAEWSQKAASHLPAGTNITGIKLAYAAEAAPDPYAGFEARIVPENITLLPKTANKTTGGTDFNERTIAAKKGDTVASILKDLGAEPDKIAAIVSVLGSRGRGSIKEGDKLRVLVSPTEGSTKPQPIRVIVADDSAIKAVVALSDVGNYVPVDAKNVDNDVAENDEREYDQNAGTGITLYQSVYETALRDQVPRSVIEDLIRIYSFDVDFQRKVRPGDSFEVLYAGEDETTNASADQHNEVMFAALTIDDETKRLYRFQTPDDGLVDYYDENGKSAKKFLIRKPVAEGIMRSGFGLRRHPILGYVKMHTGVDWAGPTGTPVYAAGNGTIEKEGWESGYGKFILIRHNNGYETAYGHLSAYASGTHEGEQVHQGQVIAFMGSTGLSTGSHLHFEIRINGRFVDPMRIKLPRGRELQGPILTVFEQERERLDQIMARKPARVASSAPAVR